MKLCVGDGLDADEQVAGKTDRPDARILEPW